MPWRNAVDQRLQFVLEFDTTVFSMSELCRRHGISRTTGYKWLYRHVDEGVDGLRDRSRVPERCPFRTDADVVEELLNARRKHPTWGARKLLRWMLNHDLVAAEDLPAASTAARILSQHGLVSRRRRRRARPPTQIGKTGATEPNDVWTADFKGEFPTRDGVYCYPLTIADDFSRYLLTLQGLLSTGKAGAFKYCELAFRTYGLPRIIRTDNGNPFASSGLGRLSRLSVWWIKLGIRVERIAVGRPSENGRHERMHRTLKERCTRPVARDLRRQQMLFDHFREEYNVERPHEGIDMVTPTSLYRPSPRPFPERVLEISYPGHYHLRKVATNGSIRWDVDAVFLTNALNGEWVGLHEIDDGIWSIEFADVELGRYDERTHRFHTGGSLGPRRVRRAQEP